MKMKEKIILLQTTVSELIAWMSQLQDDNVALLKCNIIKAHIANDSKLQLVLMYHFVIQTTTFSLLNSAHLKTTSR